MAVPAHMETLLSFDLLMQLLCINAYSRYTLFNIYFILHSFPGDAVLKKKQNKQKKKNPPANAGDTGDKSLLSQEDPQEKEMTTHSSILA